MKIKAVLLLLISNYCLAQQWNYARLDPNYSGLNYIAGAALDNNGNFYLTGNYEEVYHGNGPRGFFITKTNQAGAIVWSDTMHTVKIHIFSIAVNSNNEIIVAGTCYDKQFFFGTQIGIDSTFTGFAATLDTAGNCISATTLPYFPYAFIINSDATLTICGITYTNFSNLNYHPDNNYFIGNFNDFNNANWIRSLPPLNPSYAEFKPLITSDENGTAYYGNYWRYDIYKCTQDTIMSVPVNGWLISLKYIHNALYAGVLNDNRIQKYSTDLHLVWTKHFAGYTSATSIEQQGSSVIFGGNYSDSLTIDSISYAVEDPGYHDLYLLQTDTAGTVESLITSKYPGGGYGYSAISCQKTLISGNSIYVAGEVEGFHSFGTDTLWAGSFDPTYVFYAKADLGPLQAVNESNIDKSTLLTYPNPFHEQLFFKLNGKENSSFSLILYDAKGAVAGNYCFSDNELQLKTTGLTNGFYFYRIIDTNGTSVKTGKLIHQ